MIEMKVPKVCLPLGSGGGGAVGYPHFRVTIAQYKTKQKGSNSAFGVYKR